VRTGATVRGERGRREASGWNSCGCIKERFPQECTTEGASAHFAEEDAHTARNPSIDFFLPHSDAHVGGDGLTIAGALSQTSTAQSPGDNTGPHTSETPRRRKSYFVKF
jgi:hypothetical protein